MYKIVLTIPENHSDRMMDAIDSVLGEVYPGYRRAFCITDSIGTWIPTDGSDPFIGEKGIISTVKEKRLEFVVSDERLKEVLTVISEVHPYEQPAIDVIPLKEWRSYLE